jgi:hypothetical protein
VGRQFCKFCEFDTLFATWFMPVSCLAYSLTLKKEVTCSSKMLVDFSVDYLVFCPRR